MSISIVLILRDSGRADWDLKVSNDDRREFIEYCLTSAKKKT
jgi:hypothetical protein